MLSSLFLSFREGLEAALVIGIILVQLAKLNKSSLSKAVYIGALAGLAVSAVGGVIGFNEAQELEEAGEEIFEGIMMLVAAGLIAYFILWLHKSKQVSSSVLSQVEKRTSWIGLFVLSFLSVLREGIELVIFNMTQIAENSGMVAFGSILGIALAVLLAIIVFKTTLKYNLGIIFKALGIILILIGGELFAEGLVKLIEGGGELLETIGMIVFIVPSLYIFLKDDFKRFQNRDKQNSKPKTS
ncbi:FTR1 family iron permease [Falsibacillus pallidus]|uniref:High-affinity iron transporter n=1 Tax=Falsibacillus pallidus TaxID=493781 RepID=A0A370G5I9_9BACI|nr:FTR1 family protein [Falsibacillus pallidus]RDI38480.1 high-affinity iron transporter [Falsibacillus pallidus]